ncbi:MAG: TetR/AcrR family transcriptional regulator [Pseudomonadota bacterium]
MGKDVNINVSNGTKKRGRPRAFDGEAALNAAVEVFWAKGFERASLDDLTQAMGINRPSLYAAFGDKKALFVRALGHYGLGLGSKGIKAFDEEPDINAAVTAFLTVSLQLQTRDGDCAKGCLISNCAAPLSGILPTVGDMVSAIESSTTQHLTQRFEQEKAGCALSKDFPSAERAVLLSDMLHAQAHRARTGASRSALKAQIPMRVDAVLR